MIKALDFRETTVGNILRDAEGGAVASRLIAQGMSAADAAAKAALFAAAAHQLQAEGVGDSTPAAAFWVPGRVEVLGKHTDYAGGRSLLGAVTRGFAVVSADRLDARFRLFAAFSLAGCRAACELELSPHPAPVEPWAAYPAAVARRLAANFGIELGIDMALECDLPEASGMSSSSAVICASFLALARRNGLPASPKFRQLLPRAEELCHYLGCLENGQDCGPELPGDAGVGTFGGSEDHTAIMCCAAGHLSQYAFCPTRLEATLAFPPSFRLVVAVSGATAHKGSDKLQDYNNAALLARWAAAAAAAAAAATAPGEATPGVPPASPPAAPPTLASVVRAAAARIGAEPSSEATRDAVLANLCAADNGLTYGPAGLVAEGDGAARFAAGALARRFEQFFAESERIIPRAAAALASGQLADLAAAVDESQRLTVEYLQNTVEETAWLPAEARRLGALAASPPWSPLHKHTLAPPLARLLVPPITFKFAPIRRARRLRLRRRLRRQRVGTRSILIAPNCCCHSSSPWPR